MPNTAYSKSLGASFFPASYVKWLESGGMRVVPIPFDLPADQLSALLKSINGALFTGGSSTFWSGADLSPYAAQAQVIFDEVKSAAKSGETWPLWGTCLGFELIHILGSGLNKSVLTGGWDSENLTETTSFSPAADSSRLWASNSFAKAAAASYAALPIAMNAHTMGISPENFEGSAPLVETFDVLATGVDRAGYEFVASIEGKSLPIYATQFHAEKVMYEWDPPDAATDHSIESVYANTWPAFFFGGEARKNDRRFASQEEEDAALIYNYIAKPGVSSMFVRWGCVAKGGQCSRASSLTPTLPFPLFQIPGGSVLFPRPVKKWAASLEPCEKREVSHTLLCKRHISKFEAQQDALPQPEGNVANAICQALTA